MLGFKPIWMGQGSVLEWSNIGSGMCGIEIGRCKIGRHDRAHDSRDAPACEREGRAGRVLSLDGARIAGRCCASIALVERCPSC